MSFKMLKRPLIESRLVFAHVGSEIDDELSPWPVSDVVTASPVPAARRDAHCTRSSGVGDGRI
jgi:hypothetical protein